jgi:hypothetical protein
MRERDTYAAFARVLVETPLAIVLLVLDIVGIAAVVYWVVDDLTEAAVVLIFIAILLTSQYLVFRKLWRQTQASPRVHFAEARQAQMHQASQVLGRSMATYQVTQAWFANNPVSPTESSVARGVTARVTLTSFEDAPVLDYYGQWADSNAPDNVGFNGYLDRVDIPPGHLRAKLLVVLKYPSDSECYGFTREGLRSSGDGRSARYAIPTGAYKVRVHLSGIGVDQVYWFSLSNNGPGQNIEFQAMDGS